MRGSVSRGLERFRTEWRALDCIRVALAAATGTRYDGREGKRTAGMQLARSVQLSASLLLAALGVTKGALAQSADFQNWSAVVATGQLQADAPSARAWFDGHARRGDAGTVVILRPGVGYTFAPWITAWVGYAWIPLFDDANDGRVDEHRLWQQLTLQETIAQGRILLQSRTRLEQRLHESTSSLGWRAREFVRFNYRPTATADVGLAIWDELFVGLNEPAFAVKGYDQNRLFVGPALYTPYGVRLEAGYLFVHLNRSPESQVQHVAAVNIFVALSP